MIDINIIKKYLYPIEDFYVSCIQQDVEKYGAEEVFNRHLRHIDCTRVTKDGQRLQQTIGVPYMSDMTQLIYIIENYFTDSIDDKLKQVIQIHENNLLYEIENPPIIYDKKKKKVVKQKEEKITKPAINVKPLKFNFKPV